MPRNPLDVLAQQVVAMCALDEWHVDDVLALVRRAAPFATLPQSAYDAVLDMLAGRYPSDEFAELRPRLVWDRTSGMLTGRPGAQRLAVTSGGTIPDRGLFAVYLVGGSRAEGARVGELDEEMVYESRVGDVFALGASSWRIEDITHDRVLVSPAPGLAGRLPFWHGDSIGRPYELGRAMGAFVREVAALPRGKAEKRLSDSGLDDNAVTNLLAYLDDQKAATVHLPDDRTIVVERFRDELGDWRIVVHSPFGARVHAPWALAIGARVRERHGVDAQVMHADDGIVLRLPDVEDDEVMRGVLESTLLDPDEVEALVTAEVGGSALFAARFRESAARALLLPRRNPGQALAAVAAAAAVGAAALRRVAVRLVPDRARDDARGAAGRLRRARPRRAHALGAVARGARRRGRDSHALAVRPLAAVRLRRGVPLRGRLAAGRAPRRRAHARLHPARRAARPGRAARPARPRRRSRRSRPSCSGSCPSATRATPRAPPTCCGCSARSRARRWKRGSAQAEWVDSLLAVRRRRGARRRRDRGGLGGGRRAAARRARHRPAGGPARRVPRAGRRSRGRPRLALGAHARPVPRRPRPPPRSASAPPWWRARSRGSRRPGAW